MSELHPTSSPGPESGSLHESPASSDVSSLDGTPVDTVLPKVLDGIDLGEVLSAKPGTDLSLAIDQFASQIIEDLDNPEVVTWLIDPYPYR